MSADDRGAVREAEEQSLRILVESMVRAGCSERAIVTAVNDATRGGRMRRVLIAEDETLIRLDVRRLLEADGYHICGEASDGLAAVALAERERPDVVLLDVNMPVLDGVEGARRILETQKVPIVMLTAYGYGELISRALEMGVVGFVVKPFTERALLGAVRAAVGEEPGADALAYLHRPA